MAESAAEPQSQSQAYLDRFSGVGRLFGRVTLKRIHDARIAVIGVGGVGSWAAEALARSGFGAITLIDLDDVCVSNINRQLHALDGNIGRSKVAVMAERMRRIQPECDVKEIEAFLTKTNVVELISTERNHFDVVIDAIDEVDHKCVLIDHCYRQGVPLVVAGGAGGKSDPASVRCDDIARATHDRLLKKVRRKLRQEFDFPDDGGGPRSPYGIASVFSVEEARFPWSDGTVHDTAEPNNAVRLNCENGFGTASFVTGAFGFAAAAAAVRLLK